MDLNWLRDFISLGRTLSFTRAAEERNITQSAFSRRIKSLESWAGVALIDRASFPVKLTPEGEQFLPVAKEAVVHLLGARQAIRDQDIGEHPFLRFAVLHTISVNFLSTKIEELEHSIANLRTRVISDSLSTCCQLLTDGACDFLLCYRHPGSALVLDESQFSRKDIAIDKLLPVAQTKKATLEKWKLPGSEQSHLPYLAYDRASFLGSVVEHITGNRSAHFDIRYVDSLVEAIKRRTLAGGGIAWLPHSSVKVELASGELIRVGDKSWEATMDLSLFCSPDRLDSIGVQLWDSFA